MYLKTNLCLIVLVQSVYCDNPFTQTASPELLNKYRSRFNETLEVNSIIPYSKLLLDISTDEELGFRDSLKLIDDLREFTSKHRQKEEEMDRKRQYEINERTRERKYEEEMDKKRQYEINERTRVQEYAEEQSNKNNRRRQPPNSFLIMLWCLFGVVVILIGGCFTKWYCGNVSQGTRRQEQRGAYAPSITFEPHLGMQPPSAPSLTIHSPPLTIPQPNLIYNETMAPKQDSPPPYDAVVADDSFVPARNSRIPGPK